MIEYFYTYYKSDSEIYEEVINVITPVILVRLRAKELSIYEGSILVRSLVITARILKSTL